MIFAMTGRMGTGKSYSAVYLYLVEAILHGSDCFINFHLNEEEFSKYILSQKLNVPIEFLGQVWYWSEFEDLRYIVGGNIIIDEAQNYFDAHDFKSLPAWFRQKCSNNRKEKFSIGTKVVKTNIIAITQDLGRLDKNFRRYCYQVIKVKKLFKWFFLFYFDFMENEKDEKQKFRRRIFKVLPFRNSIANLYDTDEIIIGKAEKETLKARPYRDVFDIAFSSIEII